jgi:hypothetical protein
MGSNSMAKRTTYLATAAILALAELSGSSVNAATIFSTGFEPPNYTAGPLAGQQGWSDSGGTVETGTVFTGVQAVGYDATGVSSQTINGIGVPTAGQGSLVQASDEFFVGALNGSVGWNPLVLFGNTGFLAEILIQNGIATFGFDSTFVGAIPVSIGVWNNYTMDVNFATGSISGFVDGVLIGTGSLPIGSTDVDGIELGINSASGSTAQGFVDNLSVTSSATPAVPEPSIWAMMLIGFAGLGYVGSRQTKRASPALL